MKLKKWLSLFLVLCMLLSFAACGGEDYYTEDADEERPKETTTLTESTESEETAPEETAPVETQPEETKPEETVPEEIVPPENTEPATASPLLYKVTDGQGNVAWLFGSIHAGLEYYYPLPEYVTSAYAGSDALAVEFDILAYEEDLEAQMSDMMQLVYTDGTTIRDHLSDELYTAAVEILTENGMYSMLMDYYCVSLWSNMIDNIVYEAINVRSDLGVDRHLLEKAYADGKKILDVESSEFQTAMMANYSEPLQVLLLESSLESYADQEAVRQGLDEMLTLWASGDEEAFAAYLSAEEEFSSPEEEQLYQEYNNAMLISRNLDMADFVEDALVSGEEVFVCVGAAHVVGPDAMVELLRERGYTVELVKE